MHWSKSHLYKKSYINENDLFIGLVTMIIWKKKITLLNMFFFAIQTILFYYKVSIVLYVFLYPTNEV